MSDYFYLQHQISQEHVDNNKAVRNMMLQRGIVPENLPAGEDVKNNLHHNSYS